jgi:tRNA 5-methylaminomethyl-2-thiouridine biosynthesis bifunctional protein
MSRLPPSADLDWSDEGALRAASFGDVYFSREGGLAESEAVFLGGCGLPEGWRDTSRFAICELGFGTGLNVLAAWRAWKKTKSPHAILHISSVEAFPLERADAARALARFPEISDLSEALLERWPVRAYAPQRIWFPHDGFAVTLFTGEAEAVLAGLDECFDAWFLDGFAPSRNPQMWTPSLFQHIARLSRPQARLATFTVAGEVRRNLEAAGFELARKPGFGSKRERLEGRFAGRAQPRGSIYPYAEVRPARVAIVGAGVAGAACAQALKRRDVEAVVLEAARSAGEGASGNPVGLVMPRLDRGGILSQFHLSAYLHAIATYEALGEGVFEACGVEVRAGPRDAGAMADLLADPPLPPDWFGPLSDGAALHARAGLLRPGLAIEAMLRGSELLCEAPVERIERSGEGWVLRAPDGRAMLKADAVVLACGAAMTRFEPARFLPIALSRGQIEWGEGPTLRRAIVSGSYVAPYAGGVLFGATFDPADAAAATGTDEARKRNMAALARLAPEIAVRVDPTRLHSRAGMRATTPDRAPIAGLLPRAEAWLAQYAGLAHGRRMETSAPPPAHAGVYVVGGLGARGLTFAPLLAERIASEIFGEPQPMSRQALDALHPARFLHRALKRA